MFDFHVSLIDEELNADLLSAVVDDATAKDPSVDPDIFNTIAINRIELP